MTHISFTRDDINQAINDATATAHTKRQQERIADACRWLNSFGGSAWTLKTDTIRIRSKSGSEVYTLQLGDDCMEHQCKATKPCWHLTLGSLIMAANQLREDREAQSYGVWYPNMDCCGGQGCSRCMMVVEPAARPQLAPAIILSEASEEVIPW